MSLHVRYARAGDQHVAYSMVGNGPLKLVLAPPVVSHLEIEWENRYFRRFVERLGQFAYVAMFDKRGTGLSDPILGTGVPTLEERMDDIRAVMDALHWKDAALFGYAEGGPLCILFAGTYPERVTHLVLENAAARLLKTEDYPWGWEPRTNPMDEAAENWGSIVDPLFFERFAPGLRAQPDWADILEHRARVQRAGASPGIFFALQRVAMEIDVRDILPFVRCPTLVIHRRDNMILDVANGRYLGEKIPEARYVELPGAYHYPYMSDSETVLAEVHEFLTGSEHTPELDRILATVLFTDIVGSTERAASMGDRHWKDLLEQHHDIVRHELSRFRGREVDTAGDGFLATFDGPARGVKCALSIRDAVRSIDLEIRAGLHTGECEVMGSNIGGLAVHIGARVAAKADAGEVLVSSTVKDLVAGSGISFHDRGLHQLKGVPDEWHIFAVDG